LVGQKFYLDLQAFDPENQTITFHLKESYEGVRLSQNGSLMWYPDNPGMVHFNVIAKDRCGKQSTLLLSINATLCSCGEREICQSERNSTGEFVKCLCPDGCMGPMCSEPVPGKSCNVRKKSKKANVQQTSSTSLIVGITVGAVLLIAIILTVLIIALKRRKPRASEKNRDLVAYNKQKAEAKVFENDLYSSRAALT